MISSPLTTLAIAAGIALVALIRGTFTETIWVALLVLVLIGAVLPPAGFIFGGLILFYLLFVHGPQLAGALSNAVGGGK